MTGTGWPLLLTATIRPQRVVYLAILDPVTRFRHYAYALTWWCRSRHASPIVLVENSLSADYGECLERVAEREDCEFEFLTFQGSEITRVRGKGFGDGECIDHALSYSKTLRAAEGFYKCTGRTAVTNLADFEQANLARKNAFSASGLHLPKPPQGVLNTVFFRCETRWFDRHLRHAHYRCDESNTGAGMENIYWDATRDVLTDLSPVEPCVMGRSGALGIPYWGGDFPQDFRDEVDRSLRLPSEAQQAVVVIEQPDRYCGRYVSIDRYYGLEIVVQSQQGRLMATVRGDFAWAGGSELIRESVDSFHLLEFGEESRVNFTMGLDRALTADIAVGTSLRIHLVRVE